MIALDLPPEGAGRRDQLRSEEHTSELQSQSNLVCRLLLEKKNRNSDIMSRPAMTRPITSPSSRLQRLSPTHFLFCVSPSACPFRPRVAPAPAPSPASCTTV